MQHFNEIDGLIHNDDGSREFIDGGVVGGANGRLLDRRWAQRAAQR